MEGKNVYVLYIKKFRKLRRLTQEELAFKCGLSPSYISRLETENIIRDRSPNLKTLIDIANALSVCPSDILTYECNGCEQYQSCTKCKYVEQDDTNFFENNLKYYL
jgi:transcriptional regulator with XRE-family HTH domain